MSKIQELKLDRFLKDDLQLSPTRQLYDTLKEMIKRIDDNVENKHGIISINDSAKKNSRQISYYISENSNSNGYIRVIGHNNVVTAKEFVVACYEYYNRLYN